MPSLSAAGRFTTHWPDGETLAVSSTGAPLPLTVTVTVPMSAADVPAVPAISGLVSFVCVPLSGVETVTAGGVVSTVNACASL